jgi:hypothetical protein
VVSQPPRPKKMLGDAAKANDKGKWAQGHLEISKCVLADPPKTLAGARCLPIPHSKPVE